MKDVFMTLLFVCTCIPILPVLLLQRIKMEVHVILKVDTGFTQTAFQILVHVQCMLSIQIGEITLIMYMYYFSVFQYLSVQPPGY